MVARKHHVMNDVPALAVRSAPAPTQSGTHARLLVRPVLTHPHPLLAKRSVEIDPRSAPVVALANLLVATLRASPGRVSLSAPQIGDSVRLFAMNLGGHPGARTCAGLVVLANPRILARRGAVVVHEDCASVPHVSGDVVRAAEVVVSGLVPGSGKNIVVPAEGIEATCIQHEIDHLDGVLFIDRVGDPVTELFVHEPHT